MRVFKSVEPVKAYIYVLLCVSCSCLLLLLVFNQTMHARQDHLMRLQLRQQTIADISLVITKNITGMQVGFQHMLLSSSKGDLDTAEHRIRECMRVVRDATDVLIRGGTFKENFQVNFDGLDKVEHLFFLDADIGRHDVATLELRTSLALLEKMLASYHEVMESQLALPGTGSGRDAGLVLLHKQLAPFFERVTEQANRFYVQSWRDMQLVQAELQEARSWQLRLTYVVSGAALLLLFGVGAAVVRSVSLVVQERAAAQADMMLMNEQLEDRIHARTHALELSEKRLRDVALTSGDLVWQSNAEGKFIYVAGNVLSLLGVTETGGVGMGLADFLVQTPEGLHAMQQILELKAARRSIVDLVCPMRSLKEDRVVYFLINAIYVGEGPGAGGFFGVSKDITQKREHEMRLRLFQKVFETAQEGITITSASGEILLVNPAFSTITGYLPGEALGQNPRILKSEYHPDEFYETMWRTLLEKGSWTGEIWNRRKSGEAYPEWLSITAVRDEQDNIVQYVAVFHDITAMKEKEDEILRMAFYDALTGLPNRSMLQDKFGVALMKAEKSTCRYAVIFVDLDNFKIVNDSLGHEAGDILLVEVARRFSTLVRSDDLVARLGGDEFVFLISLPDDHSFEPEAYAGRIQKALFAPFKIKGLDIYVTPSIGIAIYPEDGSTPEALLKHADLAMYAAKDTGKNQCRVFDDAMTARASSRLTLENKLRAALAAGEIAPVFQPKVSLPGGVVVGMEALARWVEPDGTVISPVDFIPVAEETGLIVTLGRTMLERACQAVARLYLEHGVYVPVSVNVSALQFRQDNFVSVVQEVVEECGVPFCALELEITESMLLGDMELISSRLQVLSDLGISISIDDFGTGYSSLSYLSRLPIDCIKIDRAFVADLHSLSGLSLLQAIIQMGRSLHMRVLAEGVEQAEDGLLLESMGCEQAQGYYYAKPMSFSLLQNYLATHEIEGGCPVTGEVPAS